AESGYLTRRLVDVAQEVIITEDDCGVSEGYLVEDIIDSRDNSMIERFADRITGRWVTDPITDPETGEVLVEEDTFITEEIAEKVVAAGVKQAYIRNVFTCKCKRGICAKCYGLNMATGLPVETGEAIGVMAAQAIGEPGTQLTMRNFHTGGVANTSGDITQGLPRVEELFEARTPKRVAVIAKIAGEIISIAEQENHEGMVITVANDIEQIEHKCDLTQTVRPDIKVGVAVKAGDMLTEGQIAPKELLEYAGVRAVEEYILKEVKRVYSAQSIDISDKHLEVMIKQMLRKVVVTESGDSELSIGQILSLSRAEEINEELLMDDKATMVYNPILLGISKSAVETDSFLSAASFQETTRVLTEAAVNGKIDRLNGLKENVIIGKLIPAGTGRLGYQRETTDRIVKRAEELKEKRHEKAAQLAALTAAVRAPEDTENAKDSEI
ncbi:MAG: DNA-directed RNA polymerase subunit beta', partial [Erysipelotrichaceae bacterium]|nr:DNA-directed RNA polymerase subunit beta' [Erysipelotrichaceae bacterium]